MWLILTISTLVIFTLYWVLKTSSKVNHWEQCNIQEIDTSVISYFDIILGRKSLTFVDSYVYDQIGNGKFGGVMEMGQPILILKDLTVIKNILIKDFDHFADLWDQYMDDDPVVNKMIPLLRGQEWKGVRSSVCGAFTTGKLKQMVPHSNTVAKEWVDNLILQAKGNTSITINDLSSCIDKLMIDLIGATVFGMKTGAISDPNSLFLKYAKQISKFSRFQKIKFMLGLAFPSVFKYFKIRLLDHEALNFFKNTFLQQLKSRSISIANDAQLASGKIVQMNDFIQMILNAKKAEMENTNDVSPEKRQWLTENVMNALCLSFFVSGFRVTGNLINFAIYMLAARQDIQDKVRAEVEQVCKQDGSLEYEDIRKLAYMDMFISEIFRKYPPGSRLQRKCVKDYEDLENGLILRKGALVAIPVKAIHNDPNYYENPDEFNPELHFGSDQKGQRSPYAFIPFGAGPRNCLGMRYALIETKLALARLVANFRIEPTEKTPLPVKPFEVGNRIMPPNNLEVKLVVKHL